MLNKKNEKCWICGRTKKDIELMMGNLIEEDIADVTIIKPEQNNEFEFFKKNNFYLCGICWRLLNGYIDGRHECLHDDNFDLEQTEGIFQIKKIK
jgi:hypothetical protein